MYKKNYKNNTKCLELSVIGFKGTSSLERTTEIYLKIKYNILTKL